MNSILHYWRRHSQKQQERVTDDWICFTCICVHDVYIYSCYTLHFRRGQSWAVSRLKCQIPMPWTTGKKKDIQTEKCLKYVAHDMQREVFEICCSLCWSLYEGNAFLWSWYDGCIPGLSDSSFLTWLCNLTGNKSSFVHCVLYLDLFVFLEAFSWFFSSLNTGIGSVRIVTKFALQNGQPVDVASWRI